MLKKRFINIQWSGYSNTAWSRSYTRVCVYKSFYAIKTKVNFSRTILEEERARMNEKDKNLKCKGHHWMYIWLRHTCSIARAHSLSFVCACVEISDDGRLSRTKLTSKKYILRKIYTSGVNFHCSASHRITLTINKQLYRVYALTFSNEEKVRIHGNGTCCSKSKNVDSEACVSKREIGARAEKHSYDTCIRFDSIRYIIQYGWNKYYHKIIGS